MPRKRLKYESISWDISDDELKVRLNEVAHDYGHDGLSSEEEYLPESELEAASGNSWTFVFPLLYYGPRSMENCKAVRYTSDIPIDDKVLTRNGKVILASGSFRAIQELSELIVRTPFSVVEGLLKCDSADGLWEGPFALFIRDRPFPYYYASSHRTVKGFVFHTLALRSNGDTRAVTFVKLGGEADLPEDLRGRLIYILPMSEREEVSQELTRLLPLDWCAPVVIRTGRGRDLYVTEYQFMTTNRGEVVCPIDHREVPGVTEEQRYFYVHQIEDGVIKRATPDPKRFMPDVIERASRLGGKLVDFYTPVERRDVEYISRKVYRRLKKYSTLLALTKGRFAATLTDLSDKLRMSVQDLLIAAANDIHVHQAIPELTGFLGGGQVCQQGHRWTCLLLKGGTYEDAPFAGSQVSNATTSRNCGVPMKMLMDTLYRYAPKTRSYYAINRPFDIPVRIISDGYYFQFIESEVPVPVMSTPFGVIAGAPAATAPSTEH